MYFSKKYTLIGNQRKYTHEENKCTLFVVVLQVTMSIAIVYMPQEKNMQIILKYPELSLFFTIIYGNISGLVCMQWL